MPVGMAIQSSEFGTKQLITALGASILYASISLLFDPDRSEYITADTFADFRPAIFFPAIVAVLYGPIVGAVAAGLGNLLFDVTNKVILDPYEPLEFRHFIGFLANLVGGYIAGLLAKPSSDASTLFELDEDGVHSLGDYFNLAFIRRIIRNSIAAIIGLGFITGLIIGYGGRLEPLFYPGSTFDASSSFDRFASISFSNGLVLAISIPVFVILFSIIDYRLDRKAAEKLASRRIISISTEEDVDFEIVEAVSPKGDELWNLSWGAIRFVIRNISTEAKKFSVRVSSNDIFSPHRHQTPELAPGEDDEMYFNVYGISPGAKSATMYVQDDSRTESQVDFTYQMGSSSEIIINKLMGIFLMIGLVVSAVLVTVNIGRNFELTPGTILALVALPVEIVIIGIFYWFWNLDATDSVLKTFRLRKKEQKEASQLVSTVDEGEAQNEEERMSSLRLRSYVLLVIASAIFLVSATLVVAHQIGQNFLANDLVILIIVVLVLVLLASDYYIEEADEIKRNMLNQQQLDQKVIREAQSDQVPEQFTTTRLTLQVNNPFETQGMRIYVHSIDNVSPKQFTLPDLAPDEQAIIQLDFTALDSGEREVGFEFVQYRDDAGNIVIPPVANTFDQEALKFKVSGTRVFGLSPSQIGLLRKLITAIGAITLAISFMANLLRIEIDQDTIETTVPLIIILQSPVVFLILYLQNRFKKALDTDD